nr:hypothetical protein [uncultured Cohaesibacter sp.]
MEIGNKNYYFMTAVRLVLRKQMTIAPTELYVAKHGYAMGFYTTLNLLKKSSFKMAESQKKSPLFAMEIFVP